MACKYKKFDKPCLCQVTNGECQFLISPYDDQCPILAAYYNYDKYWIETSTDDKDTTKIDNIKVEDSKVEIHNLDIRI